MAEVDSLTIRINAETGSAVAQLKQITQLVEKLNSATNDNGWKSFAKGFTKLGKASENVEKLVASLKKLEELQVSPKLQNLGDSLKGFSKSASSASRTVKNLDKAAKDSGADNFAKKWRTAVKDIEAVNKGLSSMGRDLYASFNSTGIIADLDGMSGAIAKNIPILGELTSAWKSAASQIKNIVLSNASIVDKASQIVLVRVSTIIRMLYSLAKLPFGSASMSATKGIMGLVVSPLKNFASTVADAKKRWDKFISSLGRIAVYRLIRTALKEITKAMKEGIQNLYLWSQAWQSTYSSAARFVNTMDKLATAFLYLKNSVGAMISPLLDIVAPVIDALVDKFVALANAINQVLAILSGSSVWRKALKYQYSYAEAANLTTKALKRTVLAFDELNKLDDPKGGGKNDNLDYSKMFEEVPVDDWVKRILDSSSWRILGTGIADKINEVLENLNWSSIKSSARIWARRFGSLLDGVLMGISMPLVGKTLAEGLNTIALFINTFFKEFHFRELGKNLSEGFKEFIDTLEWAEIGKALTQKWKALFELIIGFKDVDLTGLGQGISDMFVAAIENLPIKDLVDAIKTLMPKVATEIGIAINGIIAETNKVISGGRNKGSGIDAFGLGAAFATAIDNMLSQIDPKEAGVFLSNGIKKIIEFTTGALKTTKWAELNTWVGEMFSSLFENIDLKQGVQNAIDLASKIVELLTTAVNAIPWEDVGDAIASADTTELKNGVKRLFESVTDGLERAGFMDEVATGIATYFGLKLTGAIAKILPTILTAKAFSGGGAGGAVAGGGLLSSILGGIGIGVGGATAGAMLGQQISHHIIGPMLEAMGSADAELYKNWTFFGEGGLFQASLDNSKYKLDSFKQTIEGWATGVGGDISAFVTSWSDGFKLLSDTIGGNTEAIGLDIEKLKNDLSAMADNWALEHPLITAGFDSIKRKVESFGTSWKDVFNSMKRSTNSNLDAIQQKFSGVLGFLTGGINQLIDGVNTLAQTDIGKGTRTASSSRLNIHTRATGGMVDKGDLFLAGEAGPEIVTSFGGDSAVMNMDQIISTISQSVAMANGGDITIPISLDGGILDKVIVTAQQRQSLRSGR